MKKTPLDEDIHIFKVSAFFFFFSDQLVNTELRLWRSVGETPTALAKTLQKEWCGRVGGCGGA